MQATSVDLRFKTKQIFEALDRGESVELLQRGKLKGKIVPVAKKQAGRMLAEDHPCFGVDAWSKRSAQEIVAALREPRYRDL